MVQRYPEFGRLEPPSLPATPTITVLPVKGGSVPQRRCQQATNLIVHAGTAPVSSRAQRHEYELRGPRVQLRVLTDHTGSFNPSKAPKGQIPQILSRASGTSCSRRSRRSRLPWLPPATAASPTATASPTLHCRSSRAPAPTATQLACLTAVRTLALASSPVAFGRLRRRARSP